MRTQSLLVHLHRILALLQRALADALQRPAANLVVDIVDPEEIHRSFAPATPALDPSARL